MSTTKTVNTVSTHTTGTGTVLSHAASVAPYGGYSLHDTFDPNTAGLHNCIWPIGSAPGQTIPFTKGLVVMPRLSGQTGSVTITIA